MAFEMGFEEAKDATPLSQQRWEGGDGGVVWEMSQADKEHKDEDEGLRCRA